MTFLLFFFTASFWVSIGLIVRSRDGARYSDLPDGSLHFHGRRAGRALRLNQITCFKQKMLHVQLQPQDISSELSTLFSPDKKDIWMEIGFGSGEHLIHQMNHHPGVGFIGCEPFLKGVVHFVGRLSERHLPQVKVFPDNVHLLLPHLPDKVLSRVFILFPDPWPKKRHHKRRLINPPLLSQLSRILKPGGRVYIASDDPSYVRHILESFRKNPLFYAQKIPLTDEPETWPLYPWLVTRYCQKAQAQGKACAHMIFIKQ